MSKRTLILAAIVAAGMMNASVAHAGWIGDSVNLTYYFPDLSAPFASNIGTGPVPTSFSLSPIISPIGSSSVAVNSNQIVVNLDPGVPDGWTPDAFNGWVLTDITKDPGITGVTIDSQSNFALTQSGISFTSDSVTVNWQGLDFGPTTSLVLDVAFGPASVPEPGTLALFGVGLSVLGLMRRRKKRNGHCLHPARTDLVG